MKFTGERFIPTEQGKIRLEHYHRYAVAIEAVKDKDVLDVACGEGYGSNFLADIARSVVGVDISNEAVQHALSAYSKDNLRFCQGSATALDFSDDSFDVVVSFETIEHLEEQDEMLAEIRRVLRADGILIISSPNRPVYSEESGEHNHFHVKELDFNEFDEVLKTQFPAIEYLGQRMLMGSVIQNLDGGQSNYRAWYDDGDNLKSNAGHMEEAVYFLAICSASNIPLPSIDMSVLYPEKLDLIKHYVGFAKWAQTLDQIVSERNEQLNKCEVQIAGLNQLVTKLGGQIPDLNAENTRLNRVIVAEQANFEKVIKSSSWQLTKPLREARRWLNAPLPKTTQYLKLGLRFGKRAYKAIPFSDQTKAAHRNVLSKYLPILLREPGVPEHFWTPRHFAHTIVIPSSLKPLVSVIIPVFGKVGYTLQCLASIAANPPSIDFEVIIVDDCSPDDSLAVLSKIDGVLVISSEFNQGFIRSCNIGSKTAKGEFLLFLNNDTEVTPGWLEELFRTFQEFPGTGLVGSKLVYPDGRLQEAGGIIWRDGSAWNFGHSQDPAFPVYNYAREVDYCSGASIMTPKVLFEEIGGFDLHFLPAYCEDSDYALKVRDKGYRVIYQPLSSVVHYEGVTSGTDVSIGIKSYQVENTKKLYERWKERLLCHQEPGEGADNAKDRRASRRVLVIDHCTPTPDQDAGSLTALNSMLLLREMDFQVTFISDSNFQSLENYTANLQRAGIEALYAPYVTTVRQHLEECGQRYDLVFLFRPNVFGAHFENVRQYCPMAKVLYHTVDLHFLRMSREAELQSDADKQIAADEMKLWEMAAIQSADASIVHSTTELELLQPYLSDVTNLRVFPLIMDVKGSAIGFADRRDIVFVGGFQHLPNVDAVHYFVAEIMPLLRSQLLGVRFHVVGSHAPAEIQSLASEDVIIDGFVEKLTPMLDRMRVSVAPLRYGAGIKGKIGSAMAVGLPVVATPLAVEGMLLADGCNVLVADDPQAFADAITQIYHDEDLWAKISGNSVIFAEEAWGAGAARELMASILTDLGFEVEKSRYPLSLYTEFGAEEIEPSTLNPISTIKSRKDYEKLLQSDGMQQIFAHEKQLLDDANSDAFVVEGFCVPCEKKVPFLVDLHSGGQRHENGQLAPNWRERLECPSCGMNNRQRLVATLLNQTLSAKQGQQVYLMEQVTPIYNWAVARFINHHLQGSEYLGYEYEGGATIEGIRHEDVENLSFLNVELDLIVSNDVFEHVPNPAKAFTECSRVLKPGGVMLATIPFHSAEYSSVIRARIKDDGDLEHVLSPVYHGNPVSADGSLVFTDFGWEMLELMSEAGFSDVNVDVYASAEYGHFGGGQIVFRLVK